jgi:hypothetical protein
MANKKLIEDKEKETEVKAKPKKEEEEYVNYMSPLIPGQDPEETVTINYETTKFKKGRMVRIKKSVAEVLANRDQAMMVAYENQKKFEDPENQRYDL